MPVKWAALLGTPVVALLLGTAAVGRRERTLRLVEIGRAAQRERATARITAG